MKSRPAVATRELSDQPGVTPNVGPAESAEKPKALSVVLLCISLMLAYALSSGPAVYFAQRGFVSFRVIRAAYAPLLAVAKYSGSYYRYTNWWIEKARN